MEEHISTLEDHIEALVLEANSKFRKDHPELEPRPNYTKLRDDFVSGNLELVFFHHHLKLLQSKLDIMNNLQPAAVRATNLHDILSLKTVNIVPRSYNNNNPARTNTQKRNYKAKKQVQKMWVIDTLKELENTFFEQLVDKTVRVLNTLTDEVEEGTIMVEELTTKNKTAKDEDVLDFVVWRIAFDKAQVDLFMDTEAIRAVYELTALNNDEYLFEAPLKKATAKKENRKRKALDDNSPNNTSDNLYLNSFDYCINVGKHPASYTKKVAEMTTNSEQSSSVIKLINPQRCVNNVGQKNFISKFIKLHCSKSFKKLSCT